jgi:hypothetical protein
MEKRLAIDRLNPPVSAAQLQEAGEVAAYPTAFALGYAKTIEIDLSSIGRRQPLLLIVPMTPREVKDVMNSEGFTGFFLPISIRDFGWGGSCRTLSVPKKDALATASPEQRVRVCPPWNRLFSQDTLKEYGADGARFVEYQDLNE